MKFPILILTLLSVAACSGGAPYVDRPYAINREVATFPDGPEIVAGSKLAVCYAKSNATPAQIRALAYEECAKGGLGATFVEQYYDTCPILTPIAASFVCENSVATRNPGASAAARIAPAMPSAAFEAPKPAGAGRAFGSISAADVSTTAKSKPFPTYLFNNAQPAR